MKYLFIDANIWLSLYSFTSNDLDQFSKLRTLKSQEIKLVIPSQTRDEVVRNRDARIKQTLSEFKLDNLKFPAFCKNYPEYESFSQDYDALKMRHTQWCTAIRDDIRRRRLPADVAIEEFFDSCPITECTSEMIHKAELRSKLGNPPGKKGSIGDAVNWECLLATVPDGQDLFLVSEDNDYKTDLHENNLDLFLSEEWKTKKNSAVHLYTTLVEFLDAHVQEIKLQTEQKKDELIHGLKTSGNFQTTHAIIRSLTDYSEWSNAQIEDLCDAVIDNNQVGWILQDYDVFTFFDTALPGSHYSTDRVDEVKQRMDEIRKMHEDDTELPF